MAGPDRTQGRAYPTQRRTRYARNTATHCQAQRDATRGNEGAIYHDPQKQPLFALWPGGWRPNAEKSQTYGTIPASGTQPVDVIYPG